MKLTPKTQIIVLTLLLFVNSSDSQLFNLCNFCRNNINFFNFGPAAACCFVERQCCWGQQAASTPATSLLGNIPNFFSFIPTIPNLLPILLPGMSTLSSLLPGLPGLPNLLPSVSTLPSLIPGLPGLPNLLPSVPTLPSLIPGLPGLPNLLEAIPTLPNLLPGFRGQNPIENNENNIPTPFRGGRVDPNLPANRLISSPSTPANIINNLLGFLDPPKRQTRSPDSSTNFRNNQLPQRARLNSLEVPRFTNRRMNPVTQPRTTLPLTTSGGVIRNFFNMFRGKQSSPLPTAAQSLVDYDTNPVPNGAQSPVDYDTNTLPTQSPVDYDTNPLPEPSPRNSNVQPTAASQIFNTLYLFSVPIIISDQPDLNDVTRTANQNTSGSNSANPVRTNESSTPRPGFLSGFSKLQNNIENALGFPTTETPTTASFETSTRQRKNFPSIFNLFNRASSSRSADPADTVSQALSKETLRTTPIPVIQSTTEKINRIPASLFNLNRLQPAVRPTIPSRPISTPAPTIELMTRKQPPQGGISRLIPSIFNLLG